MPAEPERYRTVADVDDYFANQLFASDWTNGNAADKIDALLGATRAVDSIKYSGKKAAVFELLELDADATQVEIDETETGQLKEFPRDDADDIETWKFTIDATGGTVKLIFNGESTAARVFNASITTWQAEIDSLPSLSAGDVIITVAAGGTDTVGPYDLSATGIVDRYNQFSVDPIALTGGGATASTIVVNDNVPTNIFRAVCEEARGILSGRDPDQQFRNIQLTSTGTGGSRISLNPTVPDYVAHHFTTPRAWKYVREFVEDNNSFAFHRLS